MVVWWFVCVIGLAGVPTRLSTISKLGVSAHAVSGKHHSQLLLLGTRANWSPHKVIWATSAALIAFRVVAYIVGVQSYSQP